VNWPIHFVISNPLGGVPVQCHTITAPMFQNTNVRNSRLRLVRLRIKGGNIDAIRRERRGAEFADVCASSL
jgi:hypothetical protein